MKTIESLERRINPHVWLQRALLLIKSDIVLLIDHHLTNYVYISSG